MKKSTMCKNKNIQWKWGMYFMEQKSDCVLCGAMVSCGGLILTYLGILDWLCIPKVK